MHMPKKTYFILQRIEADGQVINPAAPDEQPVTAQLSDEAAASLLPLGSIAEAPAAAKPKLTPAKDAA
jgi:hypothetical protein